MKRTSSPRSKRSTKPRHRDRYPLHQSALFRIGSKKRLAAILHTDANSLITLSRSRDNYREFELEGKYDPVLKIAAKSRWAQEPKPDLKRLHERVLRLLQWVDVPAYLFSAVKGRSYSDNAKQHKHGQRLLKIDIRRFFPSTTSSRVFNFFKDTLQCAPDVSRLLAQLVTCDGVLPTGSPLSPLMSFFANRPLFDALNDFASINGLTFTCYVDDLTFSGDGISAGMVADLKQIVLTHGHRLSDEKTRLYSKGTARIVTGVVIKDGRMSVPNQRMRKARLLHAALRQETDISKQRRLIERLNGLVGEASTIDQRFLPWSRALNAQLRSLRAKPEGTDPKAATTWRLVQRSDGNATEEP